jgi:hypothetical protein
VVHADIYGYWAAIQGMILGAQYPKDDDLQKHVRMSVAAFLTIAHGMGRNAHSMPLRWAHCRDRGGWCSVTLKPDGVWREMARRCQE